MHQRTIVQLCERIMSFQSGTQRVLVALAGPPGSGKTTFAALLAQGLNNCAGSHVAAVLPMDGFHLDNDQLSALGLLHRKGAPETFDVWGFVRLVTEVRNDKGPVRYPTFDRVADKVLPDAQCLGPETRFVIFEGNYLLLRQGNWAQLRDLFDATIMLCADTAKLRERLVSRWLEHGLTAAQAELRADSNDMINVALVQDHSAKPHLSLITQSDDQIILETTAERTRHAG